MYKTNNKVHRWVKQCVYFLTGFQKTIIDYVIISIETISL